MALVIGASLNPGGIISWIVIGAIAGFLAGQVMRGAGYGIVGDVVVGIIGAFVGGLIANLLIPGASLGFWGSLIVAFLGACLCIFLLRAVGKRGSHV